MIALQKVNVKEIIIALNYRPDDVYNILKPHADRLGMKITKIVEEKPLGTAGPIL